MSKSTSPYRVGDFWLDKRRDGKSPDIWQIASIKSGTKSISYKTTKERDIERAKKALETFFLTARKGTPTIRPAKPPNLMAVPVIPQLYRYWDEQGSSAITADPILAHLKKFKAFLETDELGPNATFDDMGRELVERYRTWMMEPHSCSGEWQGTPYSMQSSKGVCGATFRRSFASVKAAINLAHEDRIVPYVWRLPPMPPELASPARERILTMEEVGAMIGYATGDDALLNWIRIMLATGVRPIAGSLLNPSEQWLDHIGRLDLHPIGAPRTKKRNPKVPIIPQLLELFTGHSGKWIPEHVRHHTLTRRWRLMRDALGFEDEVVPKTFRHTVATELSHARVSDLHVAMLLGHVEFPSWRVQVTFSPRYYDAVIPTLSRVWDEAHFWANEWHDKYAVVTTKRGARLILRRSKLSETDFDVTKLTVLASLSGRQIRDERASPCSFTGHGCSGRQRLLTGRNRAKFFANQRIKTRYPASPSASRGDLSESDLLAIIAGDI